MNPVIKLQKALNENKGVRIGQTAVVSRKVHTINPSTPQIVSIIVNSDAGQVFYNRLLPNEIIHIDLFHEIKTFNLRQLGDFVIEGLKSSPFSHLMDYIDIQTGSGGGRLTGDLCYGRSESLKKSHLNHVHIAACIPEEELESIFLIVAKVEQALLKQGVELRKIEKILHEIGKRPIDLSSYASHSDSNLRQNQSVQRSDIFDGTVELIEHFGSIKQIQDVLEAIQGKERSHASLQSLQKRCSDYDDIVKYFEEKNFVYRQQNKYYLTPRGKEFSEFIKRNRKELEHILKRTIKNLPKLNNCKGFESNGFSKKVIRGQTGPGICVPYDPENWLEEVNVPETIRRSMIRSYFENSGFHIKQQDLVCVRRVPKFHQDICLIIDASASMAGFRLRNAKYLAKYLILRPYTRISILAFQEKEINTFVPFTRSYEKLESGLDQIAATGLTPLALALDKGAEYMSKNNLKNPLIILITDGIPTVSLWSSDPINDAVLAAGKISDKKINFCCIGLQPNKDCLIKVTNAAKGKLYVLDELNREVLVEVARKSGQLL